MDELAEKLGIDPVELRIRNDTQVDPEKPQRPFSPSRNWSAMPCASGAERFGWDKRNPQPGQVRDGRWLVGLGVAAAIRGNCSRSRPRASGGRQTGMSRSRWA